MKNLKLILIILTLVSQSNLRFEETNYDLIIKAERSIDCFLAKDNTFALVTNVTNPFDIFDPLDIEKQIIETILRGKQNISMTMKCHLWKPKSDNLLAICDLRDDPTKFPFYSFTVDDYIFNYKSKNIKFISDNFGTFFQKSPFIYSDE